MGCAMLSVQDVAEQIAAREGGFVNDPSDPGGATKYGVTLGTMRGLGMDLNRDGRVDVADVKALDRPQATDIFIEHYYTRVGVALLPVPLQASMFDMYVNAGPNAVKVLQRLLMHAGYPCTDDGIIGPKTVNACKDSAARDAAGLVNGYGVARRDYYYALADARPASRKYARRRDGGKGGWITRAEEFIEPDLRLSDAEHKARTAAWPQ